MRQSMCRTTHIKLRTTSTQKHKKKLDILMYNILYLININSAYNDLVYKVIEYYIHCQ